MNVQSSSATVEQSDLGSLLIAANLAPLHNSHLFSSFKKDEEQDSIILLLLCTARALLNVHPPNPVPLDTPVKLDDDGPENVQPNDQADGDNDPDFGVAAGHVSGCSAGQVAGWGPEQVGE